MEGIHLCVWFLLGTSITNASLRGILEGCCSLSCKQQRLSMKKGGEGAVLCAGAPTYANQSNATGFLPAFWFWPEILSLNKSLQEV